MEISSIVSAGVYMCREEEERRGEETEGARKNTNGRKEKKMRGVKLLWE